MPVSTLDQGTRTEGYRLSAEVLTCTKTALKPTAFSLSSRLSNSCFCFASLPAEATEGQSRLNTVEIQAPFISLLADAPGILGTVGEVGFGVAVGVGVGVTTGVAVGTAGVSGSAACGGSVLEYKEICLVA
ncbi:hypothetical protein D3C76_1033090 [compost metagenome]